MVLLFYGKLKKKIIIIREWWWHWLHHWALFLLVVDHNISKENEVLVEASDYTNW